MSRLSGREFIKYERHIELPEVGEAGQYKLLQSKVLIVGAGGLGTPVAAYLSAGGIGNIGIVDNDVVSKSNLQRQFLYQEADEGNTKVECIKKRIQETNPDIKIDALNVRLGAENVEAIVARYDLVVDGSDNFETKYLLNKTCYAQNKPLVYGSVLGFDGQCCVFKPYLPRQPCYQCLYGDVPEHLVPSCAESAVLGSMVGIIGSFQATETIKELLGLPSLTGSLFLYNSLHNHFSITEIKKRSNCAICSGQL